MNTYGLIGYPLTHSFSAQYFSEKFFREGIRDSRFELFPIDNINKFPALVNDIRDLKGLSVTIPYKQSVIPFLTSLDDIANEVGAVNAIKIIRGEDVRLTGYNTDVFGFEESLKPLLRNVHTKALILGTGGAAKAIAFVLKKLGIDFLCVSRNKANSTSVITYDELNRDIILSHTLIINTTPAGMFPHIDQSPAIPYHFLTKEHLLFDLVYNPTETVFMKRGIEKGAAVTNGLQMLYLQAERSWQIWNKEV
ncbi:MAG: shikimate dehydrogenase [Bacteroidales bacterium]|jgi:shikimate dehydrogenase